MIREAIQLLWHTIRDRPRRQSTPDPHPGDDNQWHDMPRIRNRHGSNPQTQQDNDERKWQP